MTALYWLAVLAAVIAVLSVGGYFAVDREWLDPEGCDCEACRDGTNEPAGARLPLTAVDPQTSAVSFSRPAVKGFTRNSERLDK